MKCKERKKLNAHRVLSKTLSICFFSFSMSGTMFSMSCTSVPSPFPFTPFMTPFTTLLASFSALILDCFSSAIFFCNTTCYKLWLESREHWIYSIAVFLHVCEGQHDTCQAWNITLKIEANVEMKMKCRLSAGFVAGAWNHRDYDLKKKKVEEWNKIAFTEKGK